jgi:hypothetical protein
MLFDNKIALAADVNLLRQKVAGAIAISVRGKNKLIFKAIKV